MVWIKAIKISSGEFRYYLCYPDGDKIKEIPAPKGATRAFVEEMVKNYLMQRKEKGDVQP